MKPSCSEHNKHKRHCYRCLRKYVKELEAEVSKLQDLLRQATKKEE